MVGFIVIKFVTMHGHMTVKLYQAVIPSIRINQRVASSGDIKSVKEIQTWLNWDVIYMET
jgi:DNA-directed RNA polymerase specialized sigma54-like protein